MWYPATQIHILAKFFFDFSLARIQTIPHFLHLFLAPLKTLTLKSNSYASPTCGKLTVSEALIITKLTMGFIIDREYYRIYASKPSHKQGMKIILKQHELA